jgi:hypothetical protein
MGCVFGLDVGGTSRPSCRSFGTSRAASCSTASLFWKGRVPWFPNVCRRVLNNDLSVPLTYIVFDLLRIDGTEVTDRPYSERRDLLVSLDLRVVGDDRHVR